MLFVDSNVDISCRDTRLQDTVFFFYFGYLWKKLIKTCKLANVRIVFRVGENQGFMSIAYRSGKYRENQGLNGFYLFKLG